MTFKKILFGWFLLSFFNVNGQISQDSMLELMNKLSLASSDSAIARAYFDIGSGYRFSNIDSSLYYTDLGIEYAEANNMLAEKAFAMSLKGATLLEIGDIPESLKIQYKALKISEEYNDLYSIGFILNRIGNIYMEIANYEKANDYYFQSIRNLELLDATQMVYNEYSNIGNVYELMGNADSALFYQLKVLEMYNKGTVGPPVPEMMFRLGNAYKLANDNQKAIEFYKEGIGFAINGNDSRNLAMNQLFAAKLYKDIGLVDSSFIYGLSALETAKKISFRKVISESAELISILHITSEDFERAYPYLELASAQKDSLIGLEKFQNLQRILVDEQDSIREIEIDKIKSLGQLKQYIFILGLAALLIIAIILFRNNRQKQLTNSKLRNTLDNLKVTQTQLIQSEKMASLGELTAGIAHEIQNPLNFVNNFSEVNSELIQELKEEIDNGDLEEVKIIANDIASNEAKIVEHGKRADSIVKGMLEHSRTESGEKIKTDLNGLVDEYLRLAYHGLRAKDKSFNAELITEFDSDLPMIKVVPQDIGRVFLNVINNAFQAVRKREMDDNEFNPEVTIKTKFITSFGSVLTKPSVGSHGMELTISDNGHGISNDIVDKIFQPFFTTRPTEREQV